MDNGTTGKDLLITVSYFIAYNLQQKIRVIKYIMKYLWEDDSYILV